MNNKSKYKAKRVETAEGVFDSQHEYQRWLELKLLQKAGHIKDLRRQVKYELIPTQWETFKRYSGKTGKPLKDGRRCLEQECYYRADFVYYDCVLGREVVEDAKGVKTDEYIIKRKLMLWIHGIRIYET